MIKVIGIAMEQAKNGIDYMRADLVADTKEEVIAIKDDGSKVNGLDGNSKLTLGSTCMCVSGDYGILNSSGTWKF